MQKREMTQWEFQSIVAKTGPSVKTEQALGKKISFTLESLLMFDIDFFQKITLYKGQIVAGDFCFSDADEIQQQLETLRMRKPKVFNIETTNYCNMTCIMCPRTELMTRRKWCQDNEINRFEGLH